MSKLLHFKNQNLTHFPEEILHHKNVTNINLEGNTIKEIPNWLTTLTDIKVLYLSSNQISCFAPLCKLPKLEVLHLNNNKINKIPTEIKQLKKLKRLYLSHNFLTKLNSSIGHLTELKQLLLARNQLREINTAIGSLKKLEHLNLFHNSLNELPESIGKLERLKFLQLSKNSLKKLPDSFRYLNELSILELFSNQINSIGNLFKRLPKLNVLNIADNHISKVENLPFTINELSIYKNPVTTIEENILKSFKNKEGYFDFLFIDNYQATQLKLCKNEYDKQLKIVDLKNNWIDWKDRKDIPYTLQTEWNLKITKPTVSTS